MPVWIYFEKQPTFVMPLSPPSVLSLTFLFLAIRNEGQQLFCILGQTTNATSMCTPCSHIHSLALNHCLSMFHPFKMHGRVDVHISASLHMTHAFLLHQTCHVPNEVHLLLHTEPPSPHHHWYGRCLVWWTSLIIIAAAAVV